MSAEAVAPAAGVLDLVITPPGSESQTVREYLISVLIRLWETNDEFSPTRPLGEPDWQYPVYDAMVQAGLVRGVYHPQGGLQVLDWPAADQLLAGALQALR